MTLNPTTYGPRCSTKFFGDPWYTSEIHFKFSPSCFLTVAGIQAAKCLRGQGLNLAEIRSVIAQVRARHASTCGNARPVSSAQARLSLPHVLAVALVKGRVVESDLTDDAIADPTVVDLRERISLEVSEDVSGSTTRLAGLDQSGRRWEKVDDAATRQWVASPSEQRGELLAELKAWSL